MTPPLPAKRKCLFHKWVKPMPRHVGDRWRVCAKCGARKFLG